MSADDEARFTFEDLVSKYKELSGESDPQYIPIYIVNSCEVTVEYMWEGELKTKTRDVIVCDLFTTPNSRFMKDGKQLLEDGFSYE
ncbi:hypothetical protein IWW40_005963, partial [Coemansia sp. RSA 1250]